MERLTINRVEILGRVGADPRITLVGEKRNARFPVATKEQFRDRNGGLHEETTWHNVAVWQGKGSPDLEGIRKGVEVHLYGRIRNTKYRGPDGEEKYFSEITANHCKVCKEQAEQIMAPGVYR